MTCNELSSYVLTPEDIQKAHSEQSKKKRRETFERYRAEEREAVCFLREQGLVPKAIADELGLRDSTVRRYLRELERAGEIAPLRPWERS